MTTVVWHQPPNPCPDHRHRAVRTTTRAAVVSHHHTMLGTWKLIQHHCGEPGCPHPMGWEFRHPSQSPQSGSGECQDPQTLHLMDLARYHMDHEELQASTFAIGFGFWAIAVFVSLMTVTSTDLHPAWALIPITAFAAVAAALGLLLVRQHRRNQPSTPAPAGTTP